MSEGHFELTDCTGTILREIENKKLYKRDIARTYRLAMVSSSPTDWEEVNRAIIGRWSFRALSDIKEMAHAG